MKSVYQKQSKSSNLNEMETGDVHMSTEYITNIYA